MRLLINFNTALLIFTAAINLALAIFVYSKGRKIEVNRAFSFFLLFTSLWALDSFFFVRVNDVNWILTIRRLLPSTSALIAAYYMYFSLAYPNESVEAWKKNLVLTTGYLFSFLSLFTPLLVENYILPASGDFFLGNPTFGFLYNYFAVYVVICLFGGFWVLVAKYVKANKEKKNQLRYVLIGSGITIFFAVIFSLLLPILNSSQYFSFGPPITLILGASVIYSIAKFKLLDIEEIFHQGLLYFTLTVLALMSMLYWLESSQRYILPLLVVGFNFYLGMYVYLRNWRSKANQWFCLFTMGIALWGYFLILFQMEKVFVFAQFAFIFSVFIPAFFYSFVRVFPYQEDKGSISRYSQVLLYAISFTVCALILSGQILAGVKMASWGADLEFGPLFFLYTLYFVLTFAVALGWLYQKYLQSQGIQKMQIRYIFLGVLLSSTFGIFVAIILPYFGLAQLASMAPVATIIMVAFVSYAMIRHRLLSVEIILQRGLIYSLLTIVLMAIYGVVVFLLTENMGIASGASQYVAITITSFLLAIIVQPLLNAMKEFTDRMFFKAHYDYQKTIREVSQAIISVVNLNQIIRLIVATLIKTMQVSEISFLAYDELAHRYRSVGVELDEGASRYKHIEIDSSSAIVSLLQEKKDVLVFDELEIEVRSKTFMSSLSKTVEHDYHQAIEEMRQLGATVWMPVITKGKLITIITLGNKVSGDIFTSDDLVLLKTLAGQVALAIENTSLYEEVLSSKNYTQNILESMVNGIITTDLDEKVITCNPQCEKMLGVRSGEIMRKTIQETWPENKDLAQIISNTLKDRCYHNYEIQILSKAYGTFPVSINTVLLRDNRGKRMGALISLTDVSEMKALEGKVRQADKLAALGTMAAGMAHEIKNPLSSMKVLSQLFPLKFQDEEYRKKYQEIMPKEINRIDRIVENLLGFARASSLKFEKVKVESLLDETLNYYSEQIKNNQIKLERKYSDTPEIVADGGQLSQVFSNFILNAIQAMPSGGTLMVGTAIFGKNNNYVDVSIGDTGMGISKENQKKLFDPFFTTKYGGTGLGLTISHSIISGHRGFVDVFSEVGKGTTFKVTLPIKQEESH